MKIRINKTPYLFSFKKYPVTFGYRHPNGKEERLREGKIIDIKVLGIEITINIIKDKNGKIQSR